MKTIQIKSIEGKILFEHSQENNTTKKTLEEAVRQNANLWNADLWNANLRDANLRNADLRDANLQYADLQYANLQYANLQYADLRDANLRNADLRDANLQYADLQYANLQYANLQYANLQYADLRDANLRNANLRNADLRDANLRDADLRDATNINTNSLWFNQTRFLPEGDIIGYKKCENNIIVKLLIPKEAKRSHAFGRKCRAEYAEVLEIYGAKEAISKHDNDFTYKVGQTVRPTEPFSENYLSECESGIHFFITKVEAENY